MPILENFFGFFFVVAAPGIINNLVIVNGFLQQPFFAFFTDRLHLLSGLEVGYQFF